MSFLPKQTGRSLAIVAAFFITTATGAIAAEKPSWIWGAGEAKENETIFFRKIVRLNTKDLGPGAKQVQSAKFTMSCDNGFEAFINGKKVLAGGLKGWMGWMGWKMVAIHVDFETRCQRCAK